MRNFIPTSVSRKLAKQVVLMDKNAPKLYFGVGIAGIVGSTVLACKATLKLEDVLQTAQTDLNMARNLQHEDYSEDDRNKDVAIIYTRSAVAVGKLYAPSIALGAASIGALVKSHNILSQRNAALSAAYIALDKGFNEYRARVIEKYGENDDREFRYGTESVVVEGPTGRKKTVVRAASGEPSIYAKFFDPLCPSWSKEPEYNTLFLRCQQNYANDLLRARGHVFLNEVYDMLGIPRTKAGQVVGWCLQSPQGDKYVDFGIFDGENQTTRDFVNGREGAILLDFNVDGLIYELIGNENEGAVAWQQD